MPSPPLESIHGRTKSGVACHHHLWQHTRWNYVGRGMPSSPLGSTNGRTTSSVACQHHLWATHGRTTTGVACQHRLWAAHTNERRRALHDITSFGQGTRSNNVGRDMPSPPLESTNGRSTSGVVCDHHLWVEQTIGPTNKV